MPRLVFSLIIALAALPGCTSAPTPATEDEKTLHALGVHLGTGLVPLGLSPRELEIVKAGLSEGAARGGGSGDTRTADAVSSLLRRRSEARAAAEAQRGPALIEEAARQPGAVRLPSGIVFRELVAGTGAAVAEDGKVKAHLRGTLGDGMLIEDTHEQGRPTVLPVGQVMECWSEALRRMKVGGKARVVCPPATAFGTFGKAPVVPSNATVTYELEVVEAQP
jgi:FKBP-type peptidyl-prolyl cis-trans isomerase FkpA